MMSDKEINNAYGDLKNDLVNRRNHEIKHYIDAYSNNKIDDTVFVEEIAYIGNQYYESFNNLSKLYYELIDYKAKFEAVKEFTNDSDPNKRLEEDE